MKTIFKIIISVCILQGVLFSAEKSLEKVSLQLQWKYQFQFAGFIVAKELGYYEDVGLDVTLLEYNNSTVIEELEQGKVDFALNNSLLAFHDNKLSKVSLLATYFQRSPLVIIAQPEIKSVLDLKSKRIMMSNNNRYNSSLSILLDYFEIDDTNADFIKPSFNIEDFIDRKVDAVTAFRSNELYTLDKREVPYTVLDPVEHGFSTNAINLFTSIEKIKNSPKQIHDFLLASKKGWEYALANIEEVATLIHEKYQPNKSIEHLIYEGKITKNLMLLDLYKIGEINKEFVLKTFKQLIKSEKIDAESNSEYLFFEYAKPDTLLELSSLEQQWIEENPSVIFTGDPNWLPYEAFTSEGEYIGIVSQYLKHIALATQLQFKPLVVSTWSQSLEKAVNGDVKVISGDISNEILNKNFNPIEAYSHSPIVIVMDMHENYVQNLEDIADRRIVIIKDYGYTADIFKEYPNIDFIEVENIQEGLEGIAEGRFDAMLATMALASYTISNEQFHNLRIVGKTPIVMDLTLFVSKSEPELFSIISKGLQSITKEQENEIFKHWTQKEPIEKIDYTLLGQVSAVLILLLIGAILWNRRMHAEILKRQKIQESLEASEKDLQIIFENAQSGLMFITGERVLLKANKRLADILGYESGEEMIGLSMRQLHLSQERFVEYGKLNFDTLRMGVNRNIEYQLQKKDKSAVWCELSGKTIDENIPADMTQGVLWTINDISKRKSLEEHKQKMQELIKAERDRSDLYLDTADVLLIALDHEARVTMLNRKGEELLGYLEEELLGKVWFELGILPDDITKNVKEFFLELLTMQEAPREEFIHHLYTKDKQKLMFSFHSALLFDAEHNCIGLLSSGMDITKKVEAEKAVEKQHEFLKTVMNSVGESIMVIEKDYTISLMNEEAKKMLNKRYVADILKPKCYEVSHHRDTPCDGIQHPCPLQHVLETKSVNRVMHVHQDSDDVPHYVELTAAPLFDENAEISAIIESAHDITKLKNAQETLQYQAEHDALTNLPNRILFLDRLKQAMKRASRADEKIAVLFIDLDHFKEINDSLGHSAGDLLLKDVSSRLLEAIRESDTVGRFGGDEFAIVIDQIKSIEVISSIVQGIINAMKEPFLIEAHQFYVTMSIGIAVFPDDGVDVETLLKNSDVAMYKAKNSGRNNYQFYTEDMTERAFERIVLETQLRQSLEKNEMQVYYQIQVDALNNTIVGMEALVRWNHPDMGIVSPAKFIPLAEETGFIIALDEWSMLEAIKQYKEWYAQGLNPGILSLNLSPIRLEQDGFIERLKVILKESEADTSWLCMEVTEGQMMRDPHAAIKTLTEIHKLGIRLAVDDFGTGYSSLAYLKRLPIDKLKIDQSFIRDIPDDSDDVEITRTIIAMAKGLNLSIIAEGVETKEQKEFLLEHGCNEIQGYFYHKPSPADKIKLEV
ncbi:MAG: EAL domain-containing protein [Campylobacterota bacterium]|nr:EAL domain-containing protein [Campylobacterota bacterium]